MVKKVFIKTGKYYDSVTLMSVSNEIKKIDGIAEAVIVMGTEANKDILADADLLLDKAESAAPNDLVIVIEGEEDKIEEAYQTVEEKLTKTSSSDQKQEEQRPTSLEEALKNQPDSNLVLISVPGQYAAREAKKALKNGLNVMLFSGNVPLAKEIELKKMAQEKGLLLMGPDCGTSIINQAPLAFANIVKEGPVGIVAASGTGAQEVSTLIDRNGVGLSQVIGTGGRDLKEEVGGLEMLKDLKALAKDEKTEVIVLVSKPPARSVSKNLIEAAAQIDKKVIVNFLGGDSALLEGTDLIHAATLQEAAFKAVEAVKGEEQLAENRVTEKELDEIAKYEADKMSEEQKYIRGLYTGGTLASEALLLLNKNLKGVYSNIPLEDKFSLGEDLKSRENTVIDLGEDEFTQGKPHPMIEPALRAERLKEEIEADQDIAVVLLDIVLGYGSHDDPAGVIAETIKEAKETVKDRGGYLSVVASICGTDQDPQGYQSQKDKLLDVGVKICPSNVKAVELADKIIARKESN